MVCWPGRVLWSPRLLSSLSAVNALGMRETRVRSRGTASGRYLYRNDFLAEEQLEHQSEEGGRWAIRSVWVLLSPVSFTQRYLVWCAGLGSSPCGGGLSLGEEARAACSRKHPRTGQRKHQALWSSSQPATLHNALERREGRDPCSLNLS